MVQPIDPADDPLKPPALGQSLQPQDQDQNQPPSGGVPNTDLIGGWNNWINKPNNRAALMQFGIAMLQPVGMGETGVSHFANAVGEAGQAHQRVTGEAQQAEKASTEAELRESRARAAEVSANAAETRALQSGQLSEARLQNTQLTGLTRALTAQANARAKYDNFQLLNPQGSPGWMSYPDWIKSPEGQSSLLEGGGGTGPTGTSPSESVSPTAGRGYSAREILNNPKLSPHLQQIRTMASSGDPAQMQQAREAVRRLEPYVNPAERAALYTQLGVR